MSNKSGPVPGVRWLALVSLSVLLAAGCSKSDDTTASTAPPSGIPTRGPGPGRPGGPGGPGGMGGPGGAPLAASATGPQILQAKCGCHGPNGQGGRAPNLAAVAGSPDAELIKTIHDGKGKMPAFASQLSDDQINKVVAYIKTLKKT